MQTSKDRIKGISAVLLASILWGTTGTAATYAPDLNPLAVGSVAMGFGGLLQGIIAIMPIIRQRYQLLKQWSFLLFGALAVAIYPLAFYASMHYAGVAVGTVVSIGSAPLLSALIEWYFDRARLTKPWIYGATLGITGMLLLSLSENSHVMSGNNSTFIGTILGIIAGLTYAFYSWSARQLMQNSINPKAAMGATFGLGGLLLMPILYLTGAPLLLSWNSAVVGLYMALVPMFLGYLCYGYGLARISASLATTISLSEPVIATLLAVLLVGEKLPLLGWIGISLIIICLIVITVPIKKILHNFIRISTNKL
ncbi:EamA family transporter [Orbaceae bacterium ESL0721]|nr:EamA family transporter [Orbaceae bacterium ESL0721]